jgi:hypothetical protein
LNEGVILIACKLISSRLGNLGKAGRNVEIRDGLEVVEGGLVSVLS